ncbi:MAG: hypothetical protein NT175_13485, partial [Bacteroidetes bacterium]|nr:hypothetical protein [Bacteroidota bacterium]
MKKMNLLSLVARNTMILFLILLLGLTLNAQVTVPDGINYQAIARNASGAPLVSTALVVKVIIYDGATVVWTGPEQSVTTNNFGLFTMVVTQASSIVWQNLTTPKIEVQALIGESDGWVSMGIVNIWSVPYAKVAGNVTPLNAVFNLTNTTGLTGDCTGGYAGALTVAGGTALNGNTGIKGLLTVCGNTSIESRAFINSMYNATNDIDGALVVKGGVSVQQDVYGNAKATFKQWLKVGNTTVGLVGPNCGPWTQATLLVDGVSAFNYNVNIKGDLDVCGNISGTNFWGTTFHGTFYGPLHGWADNAYYATTAGYA